MKPSAVLHYSAPFATQALQNITRETRESPLTQDPAVTAVCLNRFTVQAVLACLLAWVGAVGPAVEGRARNLAEDQIEGSATLTLGGSPAGRPSGAPATFVPVVLTSSGRNNSFFTSELTLTNRGDQPATLNYTYTAHIGGGSGTASETLAAGRQQIVPDAIGHLRTLGIPIPNAGNRIGTLRVAISGSSRVGVMVRTTTRVADGRAGLAFPGVAVGFEEAVYLCGLRQNRQDRSNVAFQNMGTQGEITLRTTVYSGEAGDSGFRVLEAVTLAPGGFYQYSGLLATAGFTQGYVKVERVKGTAPFYAYGVINDQANSDGAFVFPVTASALRGTRGQTLPVIVETGVFASELMVTNFSKEAKTVTFRFRAEAIRTPDKTASLEWNFQPGQQVIVPNAVETMRQMGLPKIGPPGPAFAGALDATVARGDMSGIVIGARTGTSGGGGQYGVFYNAVPYGNAFTEAAWVDALQQNEENRSNLALVTTAEVDNSPSVFTLEIYDGTTGMLASTVTGIRVPARGWRQINGILDNHAPGVTQGYVLIRKTSGNNPFLAYGVINDGGSPGQRSGDGAYLAASGERERSIDPGTEAMANREVLEALYHATGGPGWVVLKRQDRRPDLPGLSPVKRGQTLRQRRRQGRAQEALSAAGRPGHQGHRPGGQVGFPDPVDPIRIDPLCPHQDLFRYTSESATLLMIGPFGLEQKLLCFLPSPTVLRDGVGHVPAGGTVLFRFDQPHLGGPDPVQLLGQPRHRLPSRPVGVRPQDHFTPCQTSPIRAQDGPAAAQPAHHANFPGQPGQRIGALLAFDYHHWN